MKDLEKHLTKIEHFDNIPSNLFKETVNKTHEKQEIRKIRMSQPSTLCY